jgi:hypothetical protein
VKLSAPTRQEWTVAAVIAVVTLALPYVLHVEHHGGWWEKVPGWWAWFGAAGCAVIIVVSQALGRLLRKPEDWYD